MQLKHATLATFFATVLLVACSGGGGTPTGGQGTPTPRASGATPTPTPSGGATPTPTATPPTSSIAGFPQLTIEYPAFYGEAIASLSTSVNPRGLVALPNGDLLIGTGSPVYLSNNQVYIIPNATGTTPGGPKVFATLTDGTCGDTRSLKENAQGIAFYPTSGGGTIFVGMECGVFSMAYKTGDQAESDATEILPVRQGPITNLTTDGDVHHSTSVAVSGTKLYVGVGSSCNACAEADSGRAVVLSTSLTGGATTTVATRFRNPLTLAVSSSGTVWAGGAGQDCAVSSSFSPPATPPPFCAPSDSDYLSEGEPLEFLDPVSARFASAGKTVDYFWPVCEDYQWVVYSGSSCTGMVERKIGAPAYNTIEAAVFYPKYSGSVPAYAFPGSFQGGLFYTLHGSWHENASMIPVGPPRVVFVPMSGDNPVKAQTWNGPGHMGGDPYSTWGTSGGNVVAFIDGFQDNTGTRYGRPTGIAVGPDGSLFIADDLDGNIFRIRPGTAPAAAERTLRARSPVYRH